MIDVKMTCSIENMKLIEEDGKYLLDISILANSKFETGRYKVMAMLPIGLSSFSISDNIYEGKMINIGFGDLPYIGDMVYETIEKKEQIMTLNEIENKLGYKIKLVSEK